jgi:HEAT repeat protein
VVGSLRFIELMIVAMLVLISLMVAITIGVKALRTLKEAWYRSYYRRVEPAIERYLLTLEPQPELEGLRPWQRDRFVSTLIVERMALLKGAGREYLMKLADDLGLVSLYLGALHSRRRWKRARAAENLGFFGGPRVAGPVAALLVDDDETVRAVAARALARIGTEEAVRALARTLDAPSEITRLRVAENLERLGHPSVQPLKESLADVISLGTRELNGPVMATQVLGNLRAAEARGVLKQAARHGAETDVRAQATLALGKIGDPDDVPTLLACSRDEAWPVRAQAANALGMIGEVSSLPRLKEMGSDDAWWVRRNACFALANMGPEGEAALLELLHGDDRYARDRAAATMEARGFTRRAVRNLSKPGRRGERARDTVSTLIKVGATRYLKDLAEAMPDGDNRDALREILEEHGIPALDMASLDGNSPDGVPLDGAEASTDETFGAGVPSEDAARREG